MAYMKNVQASAKSLAEKGIINIAGYGAPTSGTSGTGVGVCGPGSLYFDATNALLYINTNTLASPTWTLTPSGEASSVTSAMLEAQAVTSAKIAESVIQVAEVTITAANIIAMNGAPVTVVAAPGATKVLQFIQGTLIYDYATAAYGGGGAVTLNYSGGAAVSATIAAADSFGAAGDKVFSFGALNAAGGYTMPVNTALVITNAVGAFTNPGTAAGVGRLKVVYRTITHGL